MIINYSNRFFLFIRSVIIFFKLKNFFYKISNFHNSKYEENFSNTMLSSIKGNDVVWDVGANIGFYTKKFHKLVADNRRKKIPKMKRGCVVAFEPDMQAMKKLKKSFFSKKNILFKQIALSNTNSFLKFSNDPMSPTNHIIDTNSKLISENAIVKVKSFKADSFIKKLNLPIPNVIKIDTEGFELEVLQGMRSILKNNSLREIFIEVHFSILKKRNLKKPIPSIIKLLKSNKFLISWIDSSHLRAYRAN
jgi:FkbM family methyltransferase